MLGTEGTLGASFTSGAVYELVAEVAFMHPVAVPVFDSAREWIDNALCALALEAWTNAVCVDKATRRWLGRIVFRWLGHSHAVEIRQW